MSRRTRVVAILFALVVALTIATLMQLRREQALEPMPLTALDASRVRTINVRCDVCRARRFERVAERWWMCEPYVLPADSDAVAHLLAIAHASVRQRRAFGDYDPAKLGLQPAQITLELDDTLVEFGAEDPIQHDRYVRVGAELLLVPDRFSARLLESPESELDRHLVPPGMVVVDVSVQGASPQRELAVAWQDAVAQTIAPASSAIVPPGSATPIAVSLANGERIEFALRRDAAGYIAARSQPMLDYVLDEAQVQRMVGKAQ